MPGRVMYLVRSWPPLQHRREERRPVGAGGERAASGDQLLGDLEAGAGLEERRPRFGGGPVLPAEGRARTDLLAAVLHRGLACLDG